MPATPASLADHSVFRSLFTAYPDALLVANGQNLADYGYPYFQIVQGVQPFQTSPGCVGFASTTAGFPFGSHAAAYAAFSGGPCESSSRCSGQCTT